MGPGWSSEGASGTIPSSEIRPWVGLIVHVPQQADGAPADSEIGSFSDTYASAPVRIDVSYSTPLQSHAMMEPHATLAMWDDDKLILHTANQMLNQGQRVVARTLNIPVGNVRLVSPFIGDGFGGKLWVKQKEAAREAVTDLAADMLRMQAIRSSRPGIRFRSRETA